MRQAHSEPELRARIVRRRPLHYSAGPDRSLDRPAHVRAASGAAWLGERLALVQDDAQFLALVEPSSGAVDAFTLPPGPDGARLFGDDRGTKHLKLDLETCFSVQSAGAISLYALGSGSKPLRERVVVLTFDPAGRSMTSVRVVEASALYALLHTTPEFSGSELNVEGAVLHDGALLLFQRGNGKPRHGRQPVNAIARLRWAAFERYITSGCSEELPELEQIERYDLGAAGGVPYTFTDAARSITGRLFFTASAEDSSDTVTDGVVHGTLLGELTADGRARVTPLLDEQGAPARVKAEGIALDPRAPGRAWLVVDMDAPDCAADLLEVQLAWSDGS